MLRRHLNEANDASLRRLHPRLPCARGRRRKLTLADMHCLLRWLGTESSKNCCPLDRRPWGEPRLAAIALTLAVTAEAKAPSTPAPVVA